MKSNKLFKAIKQFNKENNLELVITQKEEYVIVQNDDYRFISFLQNNRILHNGMNGVGEIKIANL